MDNDQDQRIRDLAFSLWRSAERPYWIALDYWLMAELMVLESRVATNKSVKRFGIHPTLLNAVAPHSTGGGGSSE